MKGCSRDATNKLLITIALAAIVIACGDKKSVQTTASDQDRHTPEPPPGEAPEGMVWIPGGQFTMGSNDPRAYEHERPAHLVRVDGFGWTKPK